MKYLGKLLVLALFLALTGCAATMEGQGTLTPRHEPHQHPSWWGSDAACSPGCPVGQSGAW